MALQDEIILFEGLIAKPLSYFKQITGMPNKVDKFDLRLRMVKHAIKYGVEPTARIFDTTPKTVRTWLNRYRQEHLTGLNELPRIPPTCPNKTSKTSSVTARKIANLRRQFPFKGLKREHHLLCSHEAVRRILHEYGLIKKRCKRNINARNTSAR
ncbi:MAG: helix-turn-helix domain containing protein [Phycisphaerales bacterium]|nr:MAG: helix-turn-helix domain containing protein [Phycisphaerales bacterium]